MSSHRQLISVIVLTLLAAVGVQIIAAARSECDDRPADVFFLLDTSNSIWRPDFHRQLEFVKAVVGHFKIGEDHMRVGVVSFADYPRMQFRLNRYKKKEDLMSAIDRVHQSGGLNTFTAEAINYMRLSGFRIARKNVTRIAIVITDGLSYSTQATAREARFLREDGVHVFAVGVGDKADHNELNAIASKPNQHYVMMVENFHRLKNFKDLLAIKACTVTDPPTTTTTTTTTPMPTTTTTTTEYPVTHPPLARRTPRIQTPPRQVIHIPEDTRIEDFDAEFNQVITGVTKQPPGGKDGKHENEVGGFTPEHGYAINEKRRPSTGRHGVDRRHRRHRHGIDCDPDQPLDIVFVIDSKNGGVSGNKNVWKFVRNVISNLDMKNGRVRVRFIHECVDIPGLALNKYTNKNELLKELDQMKVPIRRTADLLREMKNKLAKNNDANNVIPKKKVAVYITDGESGDVEGTLREAQDAKFTHDIEIFGIGIGNINPVEMRGLVSCEVEDHLHTVSDHSRLPTLVRKLQKQFCQVERNS